LTSDNLLCPVGPWVSLFLHDVSIGIFLLVLFYFGQLSHFRSCFGAGVNKLKSFELFAPFPLLQVRSSIPLRAIVNEKQFETRGLFMSLVILY